MPLVKPVIIKTGEPEVLQSTDQLVDNAIFFTGINDDSTTTAIGSVMAIDGSSGNVVKASADGLFPEAFCLATEIIAPGASGVFQVAGKFIGLTSLLWGGIYYLSAVTPGTMTTTPPSGGGNQIVRLGIASNSDIFFIKIDRPIHLS